MIETEKKIGIYAIENLVNKKNYVGSSINIKGRWLKHRALLRHDKHENQYLQNAWNKHGEINFKFSILEECSKEDLIVAEQSWIDILGDYNLTKQVIRIQMSDESKRKMSETRTLRIADGSIPKYGSKKVKRYTLDGVFIDEFISITDASEKCGISQSQIARVVNKRISKKTICRTAKGFQWKFSTSNEIMQPYLGRDYITEAKKFNKSIDMLDLNTGIWHEFSSYKECSEFFNVSPPCINAAMNSIRGVYKGRYKLLPGSCKIL